MTQVLDPKSVPMPEYLRKHMDSQVGDSDADSMAASSISIPRVSLKGKKFRFIEGGEEISKADKIKVVILAVEPEQGRMIKSYYANGYSAGDTSPPDCSSSNGIAPDSWVQNPVSERCGGCPKNEFGSATSTNGKKTKACRDAKRLWVVKPEAITGTVYGMNVPVTSLKELSEYGQFIKKNNFPLTGVVTELSMDEDSEFPKLHFAHVGFLSSDDFDGALERHQSKDWLAGMPTGPMLEDKSAGTPKVNLAQASANIAADVAATPSKSKATIDDQPIEKEVKSEGGVDQKIGNW